MDQFAPLQIEFYEFLNHVGRHFVNICQPLFFIIKCELIIVKLFEPDSLQVLFTVIGELYLLAALKADVLKFPHTLHYQLLHVVYGQCLFEKFNNQFLHIILVLDIQ